MLFNVRPVGGKPSSGRSEAFLITDHWDDWFKYETMYYLVIFDENGERHDIGSVKIGQFGMTPVQRRPHVPDSFEKLGEEFFSVGQDDEYYLGLNALGETVRDDVLHALRDLAVYPDLIDAASREDVTRTSLFRSVSRFTVASQFQRLARGYARLTSYDFAFVVAKRGQDAGPPLRLAFSVEPDSDPPTNIHVLIGRNGVGKTHLLRQMTRSLTRPSLRQASGEFVVEGPQQSGGMFANLVSVTFSAFDPFDPVPMATKDGGGIPYAYVGLQQPRTKEGKSRLPKSPRILRREFVTSARECRVGNRRGRWLAALTSLETDPLFREADVASLANTSGAEDNQVGRLFDRLSSGHKIVLLTVTRLVEKVEEKSLVLLDEPEAHLHPPLLSAFIRALADLLIHRNGVAIVATHSPVVVQEVPAKCVWKLRRSGREARVDRPGTETFGENVGSLTHEVFGLEVTEAGFHAMLSAAVAEGLSYDEVIARFSGQLGAEGRAIAQTMVMTRDRARQAQ